MLFANLVTNTGAVHDKNALFLTHFGYNSTDVKTQIMSLKSTKKGPVGPEIEQIWRIKEKTEQIDGVECQLMLENKKLMGEEIHTFGGLFKDH